DRQSVLGQGLSPSSSRREEMSAAPLAAAISLRNVSLRFSGMPCPALNDISLDIRPGDHVALVGPSGSGQSLLLAVIAGLVRPAEGKVLVDGELLTDATADHWRRRMAWLGQRPSFVKGSVLANLALGRGTSRGRRLEDLAARLGAKGVIDRLPRGLATM